MHLYCITMHFFFFLTVLQFWGGRFKKKKKEFQQTIVWVCHLYGNEWKLMSVFKDSKKDIYLFVLLGLKRSLKKTLNTTLMKKKGGGG